LATGVQRVAILGAGTMGHGIAEVAALAGFDVVLYDVQDKFLEGGMEKIRWSVAKLAEKKSITQDEADRATKRIKTTTRLEAAKDADLVIEAAPEDLGIKRELFGKLDSIAKRAIFASNTSSIPISEIAAATHRPEKFVGIHFFNPPVLMRLVEVIKGERTDEATVHAAVAFGEKLGKKVVLCSKDVPGFIVNRILGPLINEAAWNISRKLATAEQIDSACVYQVGLPMGLLELADYTGIDVLYSAFRAMEERDPSFIPVAPPLADLFKAKQFGKKTGKGFYSYPQAGSRPTFSKEQGAHVDPVPLFAGGVNSAAWLLRNRVCTREDLDLSMRLGLSFPEGILRLADRWGLDRVLTSLRQKQVSYGKAYTPDPLLVEMVGRGEVGVSSSRGFYDYTSKETKLEELIVRKEPPIAWVLLNRAQKHNTITPKMMEELAVVAKDLSSDDSLRVVIIGGEGGKAFSAGADLSTFEMSSPIKAFETVRRMFEVFTLFERMPKPVVAAIDGYAFGGGCELALACDFRLASSSSQIGLTETSLGIIPGAGGTQRLVRLVGISKAKEMIYFGERLSADEALKVGLVDKVFPNDRYRGEVDGFVKKLAKRAPLSVKLAKQAVNAALDLPMDAGQLIEAEAFGLLLSTQDASEGISSFFAKKEPEFKGT